MKFSTKKLVLCALMAALCCVATMVIRIPTPTNGYVNLGDCIVLLSGFVLGPVYGAVAGGIGSALADLFSGYISYGLPTFIIKALMVLSAAYIYILMNKKFMGTVVGAITAEIIMIAGYFLCEATFFGYGLGAVASVPSNAMQGLFGIVFSCIIMAIFKSNKSISNSIDNLMGKQKRV